MAVLGQESPASRRGNAGENIFDFCLPDDGVSQFDISANGCPHVLGICDSGAAAASSGPIPSAPSIKQGR